MKKWIILILLGVIAYSSYILFIKVTHFSKEKVSFQYNQEGLQALADSLSAKKIIRDKYSFLLMANVFDVENKMKAGKFSVDKNTSLLKLIRMFRNNQQAKVKLVINKLRLKSDVAKLLASSFDVDSAQCMLYLTSNDSLAPFATDTTQVLSLFIPNTYEFYASSPLPKIFQKMKNEEEIFWSKKNRLAKANAIGLTKNEVYILASIVEEETNFDSDKTIIASVYQNRLKKKMPLQACPTIKYAMQDFTLTRIYDKYLTNPSPYNTYKKTGLPPGPICTPSPTTIDLVLNAPSTTYYYFVAKADFSGYHHFSTTYEEHSKFAKEYQHKLDEYQAKKNK